jgi:hypothetical protein
VSWSVFECSRPALFIEKYNDYDDCYKEKNIFQTSLYTVENIEQQQQQYTIKSYFLNDSFKVCGVMVINNKKEYPVPCCEHIPVQGKPYELMGEGIQTNLSFDNYSKFLTTFQGVAIILKQENRVVLNTGLLVKLNNTITITDQQISVQRNRIKLNSITSIEQWLKEKTFNPNESDYWDQYNRIYNLWNFSNFLNKFESSSTTDNNIINNIHKIYTNKKAYKALHKFVEENNPGREEQNKDFNRFKSTQDFYSLFDIQNNELTHKYHKDDDLDTKTNFFDKYIKKEYVGDAEKIEVGTLEKQRLISLPEHLDYIRTIFKDYKYFDTKEVLTENDKKNGWAKAFKQITCEDAKHVIFFRISLEQTKLEIMRIKSTPKTVTIKDQRIAPSSSIKYIIEFHVKQDDRGKPYIFTSNKHHPDLVYLAKKNSEGTPCLVFEQHELPPELLFCVEDPQKMKDEKEEPLDRFNSFLERKGKTEEEFPGYASRKHTRKQKKRSDKVSRKN